MMGKAEISVTKELDLVKFIRRQRFTQYATLSLLNGRQVFVTDKLSNMLIRESSDLDEYTEDDMELEQENFADVQQVSSKIQHSLDPIDKRLVNIYRIGRDNKDEGQDSTRQEESKEKILELQLGEKDDRDSRRQKYLDSGTNRGIAQSVQDQNAIKGKNPSDGRFFLYQSYVPDKEI